MVENQTSDKKYVWVFWTYVGCRRPVVERYTLVKPNPGGGATVRQYSGQKVIRPSAGKEFYYDEDEFLKRYRRWMETELARVKRAVETLTEDLAKPDAGASEHTTATPDQDIRPKNIKV